MYLYTLCSVLRFLDVLCGLIDLAQYQVCKVWTCLVWVQRDPQSQFGHPVLLQQLQVRTERHAESPRHVLGQPAVVGRVAQTTGMVFTLEEKHLQKSEQEHYYSFLTQTQIQYRFQGNNVILIFRWWWNATCHTSVQRITLPLALNSEPWKILMLVMDSMDFPSIGLMTLKTHKQSPEWKQSHRGSVHVMQRPSERRLRRTIWCDED